jgi:hypothetical protein
MHNVFHPCNEPSLLTALVLSTFGLACTCIRTDVVSLRETSGPVANPAYDTITDPFFLDLLYHLSVLTCLSLAQQLQLQLQQAVQLRQPVPSRTNGSGSLGLSPCF